jgi:NAD(P)-dependent dehydrogenase (short-subunit alcohol dehydrogenase family)
MPDSRHVIVTGGAGGIGTQLVADLIGEGYTVSVFDSYEHGLANLVEQHGASVVPFVVDVTDSASVDRAVTASMETSGIPFGLVNLAGNNILKPLAELSDDDWRFLIDANLSSAFYTCRAVMPLMASNGGGRVINTSSIFGLRGEKNDAAYSAAKAGVVGITRALATEFAADNVTVNNIAPVVVLTDRVAKMPKAHLERQLQGIPMGRFSTQSDVTRTVVFLLGPDAGFYTGQTFSPNGGELMP